MWSCSKSNYPPLPPACKRAIQYRSTTYGVMSTAGKESSGRRRVMTLVADFGEDPVARGGQCCAAAGTEDWPDGDDDVGDKCYCTVGTPSSSPVRGRCTRWYPRLRALIEGPLQTDSGGKGGGSGGVGVLINCAGVCYPHPEYFAGMAGDGHDVGEGGGDVQSPPPVTFTAEYCDNAETAVKCNVAATVHACRLVLPGMLARGRGLIVNVGSASASMPPATPLMALYAATKVGARYNNLLLLTSLAVTKLYRTINVLQSVKSDVINHNFFDSDTRRCEWNG